MLVFKSQFWIAGQENLVQLKSGGQPWFNESWPRTLRGILSHSADMSGDGWPIQKEWERGLCELDSPCRIHPKPPHHCSPMTPSFCYLNHLARLESSLVTVLPVSHPVLGSLALPHPKNRSEYKDQHGLLLLFSFSCSLPQEADLTFPWPSQPHTYLVRDF